MASHEPFGHFQHKLWQKEGSKVKLAVWLPTIKSWELTDLDVCRWSAMHRWKDFKESYKFAWDLIPIGGPSKELWTRKVQGVQIGTVLGLLLGSLGTKFHSDVGAAERCREYYMGEGDGFPWVRAMVSLMNPGLPVVCPSTKGAPEGELTNSLVGLIHVQISN